MHQKVIIIGNLGQDPEMRYTSDGTAVTSFSVATNRKWTRSDGTPGEETIWWRVSAWRKLAETCNQFLSKGRQVYIEGRMQPDRETGGPRIWTSQDGQSRASYEISADVVRFLGTRGDAVSDAGAGAPTQEEDLPF